MRARSLLAMFGMLAIACTSKKKPPSDTPPAAADERQSDGGDEQAPAGASPAPVYGATFEELCGDPTTSDDRPVDGGASVPMAVASAVATPVVAAVSFRTQSKARPRVSPSAPRMLDFRGVVVAPALKLDTVVFQASGDDPHQCCARSSGGALIFECWFSGIDRIQGSGSVRRNDGGLRVKWCTADLSTASVLDRGDLRVPLASGADIRFVPPVPSCEPRGVQ